MKILYPLFSPEAFFIQKNTQHYKNWINPIENWINPIKN